MISYFILINMIWDGVYNDWGRKRKHPSEKKVVSISIILLTNIHIHHPMFYQLIITTNNRETVFGNYDLYQEATNAVLDLINYHELSRNSKLTIITKGV